jgi:hypothetical protein
VKYGREELGREKTRKAQNKKSSFANSAPFRGDDRSVE